MKRIEAARLGLTRYFSDKPCHMGHNSERYTSTGNCIDCLAGHRNRIRQAANAHAMGWPTVSTEVPHDRVALLRLVLSLLRYSGRDRDELCAILKADLQRIGEMAPDLREVDCFTLTGGSMPSPIKAPPLPEDEDNGEPQDWHRDPNFAAISLIPPAFRGAA